MSNATTLTRVASRLDAHLALVVTTAASLLVTLKVFEAARFDPATALAIVQAGSSATLLIAMSVALLPNLIAALLGLSIGVLVGLKQLEQPIWAWVPLLLAVLYLAITAVTIGTLVAMAVLVVVVSLPLLWSWAKGGTRAHNPEPTLSLGATWYGRLLIWLLPLSVLVSVLAPSPWPTEDVRVGSRTVTAFVIEAEGEWWTVLDVDDRRVSYLPSNTVQTRRVCRAETPTFLPEWARLTLPQLGADPLPRCGL